MNWTELYNADKYRNQDNRLIQRFLFHLRRANGTNNIVLRFLSKSMIVLYRNIYGLEISYTTKIGKGLYIGHPYGITINPESIIGENCNIHKGVVIGNKFNLSKIVYIMI